MFEVGDKVVPTTKFYPGFKGKVGTVVEKAEPPYGYTVQFERRGKTFPFNEEELVKYDG